MQRLPGGIETIHETFNVIKTGFARELEGECVIKVRPVEKFMVSYEGK